MKTQILRETKNNSTTTTTNKNNENMTTRKINNKKNATYLELSCSTGTATTHAQQVCTLKI